MRTMTLSSKANPKFRAWRELDSSRGIKKHGEFLLMGEKLIHEFIRNNSSPSGIKVNAEIIAEGMKPLAFGTHTVYNLPQNLFDELDFLGTHHNLLVLNVPEFETLNLDSTPQGVELISPLGDPSNLGALIRSAMGFGCGRMILTQESSHPFHPKSVKASSGAVLKMKFFKGPSIKELKNLTQTFALDMHGTELNTFPWPKSFRLLVGEEGPGLPELDGIHKIRIPTQNIESLNATVATSIALYDYWIKTRSKG